MSSTTHNTISDSEAAAAVQYIHWKMMYCATLAYTYSAARRHLVKMADKITSAVFDVLVTARGQ